METINHLSTKEVLDQKALVERLIKALKKDMSCYLVTRAMPMKKGGKR
jgi:hypothetical protein